MGSNFHARWTALCGALTRYQTFGSFVHIPNGWLPDLRHAGSQWYVFI